MLIVRTTLINQFCSDSVNQTPRFTLLALQSGHDLIFTEYPQGRAFLENFRNPIIRVFQQNMLSTGVVVSKLDATVMARKGGDIPQNVNYVIRGEIAKFFLAQNQFEATSSLNNVVLSPEQLAKSAAKFSTFINTTRRTDANEWYIMWYYFVKQIYFC